MSCGSTTYSCSAAPKMTIARSATVVPSPFGWVKVLGKMHDRWQQRQTLLDLDDHLLRDIGLTRNQAAREARKPFWT
jgi:uncharacterized protein YjiS (DUF1127 family)